MTWERSLCPLPMAPRIEAAFLGGASCMGWPPIDEAEPVCSSAAWRSVEALWVKEEAEEEEAGPPNTEGGGGPP